MSPKKKVTLALLGSLLFHILVLLFFVWWESAHPLAIPPVKPEPAAEITLIPMEEPKVAAAIPTPTPEIVNIRSDNMIEASKPPPDTNFESDKDTLGASQNTGTGPKNMPSVEGRSSDSLELSDQQLSLGSGDRSTGPKKPKTAAQVAEELAKLEKLEPKPTPSPVATPRPPQPSPDDALAIGRAQSTPTPPPRTASPPSGGGTYRPETRATRIEGSLSNRGRPSIAARGTPMGRYLRQVETAVGSRWYLYLRQDPSMLAPGSVRIMFYITATGKIQNLRRMSNTSNENFASLCEQSILFAELPPIPEEVVKTLYTGRIELPFTFTYQPYQ